MESGIRERFGISIDRFDNPRSDGAVAAMGFRFLSDAPFTRVRVKINDRPEDEFTPDGNPGLFGENTFFYQLPLVSLGRGMVTYHIEAYSKEGTNRAAGSFEYTL